MNAPPPSRPHELVRLHMEAIQRLRELQEECVRLRDSGRLEDAKRVFREAEELKAGIDALERECRP